MNDTGVQLHSNGKYWQAYYMDLSGKPRKKGLGSKANVSRAEALRKCRRLEAEHLVRPGARNVGKAPSLLHWRDEYFKLRVGELKPGTETLHRQTFDRLLEHFGDATRLDKISKAGAVAFRAWLMEQPDKRHKGGTLKIGVLSVARHIRDCKVIFGRAAAMDLIAANPFADVKPGSVSIAKE